MRGEGNQGIKGLRIQFCAQATSEMSPLPKAGSIGDAAAIWVLGG